MRAVLQRVISASVTVDGRVVGEIGRGILALVGVAIDDSQADADWIAGKIADLRLFPPVLSGGDASGDDASETGSESETGMERSLLEIGGAALVVSQFTLMGDCRKGRRPGWGAAAPPETARALYERVVAALSAREVPVATGTFRAHMHIQLVNDGPVTVLIDSKKQF